MFEKQMAEKKKPRTRRRVRGFGFFAWFFRRVLARTSVGNKYEDEKKERAARGNDLSSNADDVANQGGALAAAMRHSATVNQA